MEYPRLGPILVALASLALGAHYSGFWSIQARRPYRVFDGEDETERFNCRPFLPKLFIGTPPRTDHPLIQNASDHFRDHFTKGDIDSLSVAVVTPSGAIFEENFGVMRGNETGSPLTHSHSMYCIASTAKLFLALEGLILSEKGALSWHDPVAKYLPRFRPRVDGFVSSDATPKSSSHMTLLQLGTHLSGLGRDWPSANVAEWPKNMMGGGPPPTNGLPFRSNEALLKSIAETRLPPPPLKYPSYSNAGTGALGLAVVAANQAYGPGQPKTYAELVQRDIFNPLKLNGSHFLATEANKHLIVVPSLGPEDQDLLDAMNPAAVPGAAPPVPEQESNSWDHFKTY
ncbi:beta-lactamase/transpeptidase-like protein [Gautieria morchelliformis]|nr:beta-lactamase/transpeptidase-like protein [Gautieria morchelliformis]